MNDRIIEIENYWTRIVRDTAEFQQIANAENPEFNKMLECVYRVLNEGFINDLTEYGASRWEKILGLPVSPTATLEERKVAILTYISVKLPYTWRVLKQMLVGLLGEGNFEMSYDNETQKIKITLGLSTTRSQIDAVTALIERVVPQNLEIEVAWANGMSLEYTPLEYLEGTGTQGISVPYNFDKNTGIEVEGLFPLGYTANIAVFVPLSSPKYVSALYLASRNNSYKLLTSEYGSGLNGVEVQVNNLGKKSTARYNWLGDKTLYVDNGETSTSRFNDKYVGAQKNSYVGILYNGRYGTYYNGFVFSVKLSQFDKVTLNMVPALDPTGAPCMFDLVTRKPFYNSGTGDFIYPTDTAPAVSADLDEKFYAKRTEHGIRRLYHVPKGCTMSKDEYAAEHGFKELVEPPMPYEGYWTPEWRETDTQLILEWVETEPPMEVTEND